MRVFIVQAGLSEYLLAARDHQAALQAVGATGEGDLEGSVAETTDPALRATALAADEPLERPLWASRRLYTPLRPKPQTPAGA